MGWWDDRLGTDTPPPVIALPLPALQVIDGNGTVLGIRDNNPVLLLLSDIGGQLVALKSRTAPSIPVVEVVPPPILLTFDRHGVFGVGVCQFCHSTVGSIVSPLSRTSGTLDYSTP